MSERPCVRARACVWVRVLHTCVWVCIRLCHLADTDLGLFGPAGFAAELETRVDLGETAEALVPPRSRSEAETFC